MWIHSIFNMLFQKAVIALMHIKYTCALNERSSGVWTSNVILRLDCNKIVGNFG